MSRRWKNLVITEVAPGQLDARMCPMDVAICDFCSDENVAGHIEAKDYEAINQQESAFGIPSISRGDWAACKECLEMIENNRWEALTQRSLNAFCEERPEIRATPGMASRLLKEMRKFHRDVRIHMTGIQKYSKGESDEKGKYDS